MQVPNLSQMGRRPFKLVAITGSCIAVLLSIHYRIGADLILILLLLFSSWCVGCLFQSAEVGLALELVRVAYGISLIGLLLYGMLTLGWGGKTQYLLLLAAPPIFLYFRRGKFPAFVVPKDRRTRLGLCFLAIPITLMLISASAPITQYDALSGHLPITMYGVRTGGFYTNIAESTTYTQTGVLYYGFSVLLASFGAYKALAMLNTVLFVLVYAAVFLLAKKLYMKTSPFVLALILFSVPAFFELSTIFYVEILPIFLALVGFLLIAELKPEQGWRYLPHLGLLFGCSLISKMTICYTILPGGVLAIVLFFIYSVKEKKSIRKVAIRFLKSGTIFFVIASTPYILAWYHYGNPFFPMFNSLFRSPYFTMSNFVDPFQEWPLGFSLQSIISIVFHTSRNIELQDGSLGIFLLLLPTLPISWLIYRKKTLLIWEAATILSYGISTLFTYNLRYYLSILVLTAAWISVSICVLFDRLPHMHCAAVMIAIVIAFPGAQFIAENYLLRNQWTGVSDEVCISAYSELLKEIPSNKRVIGAEPFKGDYNGYFASFNWHGSSWLNLIELEGVSITEYVSCFDYLICDSSKSYEQDFLNGCQDSGLMELNLLDAQGSVELYQIQKKSHGVQVLAETFEMPRQVTLDTAYTKYFSLPAEGDVQIMQDMRNDGDKPVNVRFQINWLDSNDEYVITTCTTYILQPGVQSRETSEVITPPDGAVAGILYLGPHDPKAVLSVYEYQLLQVQEVEDVFARINSLIKERIYLAR